MFSIVKGLTVITASACRMAGRSAIHTSGASQAKVALVLSGCGVYDGSEVHEASACWVHLSRQGAEVSMFAPDTLQMHVINHSKGEEMKPNRNVLLESARIARGNIQTLADLKSSDFDAVVFPGGFGAAKNLSTFAVDAAEMRLVDDVDRVLKEFHEDKKPIGLCCISPVLVAKAIPGVEVTVGSSEEEGGRWPYAGTVAAIQQMGGKHISKDVTEAHVDVANKVVTSPAFMCNTEVHEVFDGIGEMIQEVLKLV